MSDSEDSDKNSDEESELNDDLETESVDNPVDESEIPVDELDGSTSEDELESDKIEEIELDIKEFKHAVTSNEEINNFYKEYDISKNKTTNILTKYERTKVLSERSEQLSSGAIPLINTTKTNTLEIAEEELKQDKIPFIIKRLINNNYEYWKLEDLIKI